MLIGVHLSRSPDPEGSETHPGVFQIDIHGRRKEFVISSGSPAGIRVHNPRPQVRAKRRKTDFRLDCPVDGQGGIRAQPQVGRQAGTGKPAGAQAQVHRDRHGLVGIGAKTQGEIVRLALLAIEHQGKRRLTPFKMIGNRLEGVGSIDFIEQFLNDVPVVHVSRREIAGVQDTAPLLVADARKLDVFDLNRSLGQVDGGRVVADLGLGLAGHGGRHGFKHFFVGDGVLITLIDDVIHARVIERKHVVALQFVVHVEIGHLLGRIESGGRQKRDGLEQEVHRGVQFIELATGGHIGADDDVGTHFLGQVHREVVAHAAVQQNFTAAADRTEVEGNGHRGTHGGGNASVRPVLRRQRMQVGRDAGIRNRQVGETDAVLIADADGTEGVPDVQAVQIAVRHADADFAHRIAERLRRTALGLRFDFIPGLLLTDPHGQILVVIVERDPDEETVAVFAEPVADIVVRDVVRHHHGPVDVPDQGIQLVVLVSQRIQATHQAAHAGTRDDIHGNPEFFHIFDHAQVSQAPGTAAGQHQAHGRPVLPDGIHPGPHLGKSQGVSLRIGTGKNLGKSRKRNHASE